MPAIKGKVTDGKGTAEPAAKLVATDFAGQAAPEVGTDAAGLYTVPGLVAGEYTVEVTAPAGYLPAHNVIVRGVDVDGIDFSRDPLSDFLGRLDDARFSLDSAISEDEARQAIGLFSVVTLLLAGLSRRQLGREEKLDVLGVLSLYYGLQEGSLRDRFSFGNDRQLWTQLESELERLAKKLDALQSDVEFLQREAKRQFNLGLSSGVLANVGFPGLFQRYVQIGADPLLSLDLRAEEAKEFTDRTRLAEADDLLRELKGVVLQLVRSLSKYGTIATSRVNAEWASFEAGALEVLATVAQHRVTPDQDERNQWAVLADLTGKNRETEVAPYVVLARHGGKLLRYALEIYTEMQDRLDDFDRDHLRDLFQPQGREFWTTKIRREATLVRRYPLTGWG